MDEENIFNFIIDNAKRVLYPEEWIKLDLQLSKSELFSMLIIDRHGEIIMSQIADFVQIPMSTATSIVDRMVKKGLVKRGRSDFDRRIVTISLTEKGADIITRLKDQILKYINLVNSALSAEEKQTLMQIYTKIIAIWNKENISTEEDKSNNEVKRINID